MFSDEDEFLCKRHRIDDPDFRNVSFLIQNVSIQFILEISEIIDLAAFNFGNFPKHFRANRINLCDLVNESTSGSSRYRYPSNSRRSYVQ